MNTTKPVNYQQEIPELPKTMAAVNQLIGDLNFDRTIYHLVQMRASQINRCGFCVNMHADEAREHGETSARLDRLTVWDQVNHFTEKEKAALAWTEALTSLDGKTDLGALRVRLREHFTDKEIGMLTSTVAMINLWNRLMIAAH